MPTTRPPDARSTGKLLPNGYKFPSTLRSVFSMLWRPPAQREPPHRFRHGSPAPLPWKRWRKRISTHPVPGHPSGHHSSQQPAVKGTIMSNAWQPTPRGIAFLASQLEPLGHDPDQYWPLLVGLLHDQVQELID